MYELAKEMNVKVIVISTVCDDFVVFERLKNREFDLSEDAFLKSRKSFEIMKEQADLLDEDVLVKRVDTGRIVDFAELQKWLKNILL